jgi:exonuclease III
VRIATYNVNGINGRLANLLGWLEEAAPDLVCLQELKAADEKFPAAAIRNAGYSAVWHGEKAWNGVAILQRAGEPTLIRRGLPGDPDDTHSRYIEAAVNRLKVGSTEMNTVQRIAAQITTSTPDKPVLLVEIRTDHCRALERAIQTTLETRGRKIAGGGTEWFKATRDEILTIYQFIAQAGS